MPRKPPPPRPLAPFDPDHPKCEWPAWGAWIVEQMEKRGVSTKQLLSHISVSKEEAYGIRRGMAKPTDKVRQELEDLFGEPFDPEALVRWKAKNIQQLPFQKNTAETHRVVINIVYEEGQVWLKLPVEVIKGLIS